ncbi:MAG: 30S ribosomal protein S12 methylthiotransferase RimO [Firmicutes bacterium HGW-Firmicutes-11]|jgi:ribosomal protein S12 methylthiotransferase|nr:MAG: 30S ribosomal protein S12 methylthiotransferase RimO [Firmicutes bacterium HGW-Firmicutes-11]
MIIYIETLGCPKNLTDSEGAAGILKKAGHQLTEDVSKADVILVNTCGFIQDAKEESIDRILDMAEERQRGARLIVSGCLSQRYGTTLQKEFPEVDVFLGVNDYARLPEILDHLDLEIGKLYHSQDSGSYPEFESRHSLGPSYTAYLKIAEGCDNRCAYCSIPGIRGAYRSRSMDKILEEAAKLVSEGCKEIILIAQDVTAYGIDIYGSYRLPDLLTELCRLNDLVWLRLMYCYEDRISDELIQVIAENKKICRYIDIPIQHASNTILRAMKRRSTYESIVDTITRLRTSIPDIRIRTTLITGFPGETEEDFLQLEAFVQKMKFDRLGVFAYSKEEGTTAATMKPQIRTATKQRRKERIMELQREISLEHNQSLIGSKIQVLIEAEEEGTFIGRSPYDAPEIDNSVIVSSPKKLLPGEFVEVEIIDGFDYDLSAVVLPRSSEQRRQS